MTLSTEGQVKTCWIQDQERPQDSKLCGPAQIPFLCLSCVFISIIPPSD